MDLLPNVVASLKWKLNRTVNFKRCIVAGCHSNRTRPNLKKLPLCGEHKKVYRQCQHRLAQARLQRRGRATRIVLTYRGKPTAWAKANPSKARAAKEARA